MHSVVNTNQVSGVTLVSVILKNTAPIKRRVKVVNELDGPILMPLTNGTPEIGWNQTGYTTVMASGVKCSVGYACPCLTSIETNDTADIVKIVTEPSTTQRAPAAVKHAIRTLGAARPPADAISATSIDAELPSAVERWLYEISTRVERAEALTDPPLQAMSDTASRHRTTSCPVPVLEELYRDQAHLQTIRSRAEGLTQYLERVIPDQEFLQCKNE